jgi:L-cysteate sulfo-lyase
VSAMERLEAAKATLSRFPRERFSLLPTPFHRLARLSALLGLELWCKRDDLSGPALGGNKARKLDFLMADALAQQADTIVAVGAVQSNFCRLAAAAAAQLGLEAHLVLGETPTEKASLAAPRGNLLLDLLLGAKVHVLGEEADHGQWEEAGDALAESLRSGGRRVYKMPLGGSTPLGAVGYAGALLEIAEQAGSLGLEVGTVVHASGSGGTQAGLLVGKRLCGWPGDILGISVSLNAERLTEIVRGLASGGLALADVAAGRPAAAVADAGGPAPADVLIDDSYRGPDYSVPTPEAAAAIELFLRREGLVLDRVYTGKAAAGLLDYARTGRFEPGKAVVFLHTGGSAELFG